MSSWDHPSADDWAQVLATFPLFSGVGKRRLRTLVRRATFAEFAAITLLRNLSTQLRRVEQHA